MCFYVAMCLLCGSKSLPVQLAMILCGSKKNRDSHRQIETNRVSHRNYGCYIYDFFGANLCAYMINKTELDLMVYPI